MVAEGHGKLARLRLLILYFDDAVAATCDNRKICDQLSEVVNVPVHS